MLQFLYKIFKDFIFILNTCRFSILTVIEICHGEIRHFVCLWSCFMQSCSNIHDVKLVFWVAGRWSSFSNTDQLLGLQTSFKSSLQRYRATTPIQYISYRILSILEFRWLVSIWNRRCWLFTQTNNTNKSNYCFQLWVQWSVTSQKLTTDGCI